MAEGATRHRRGLHGADRRRKDAAAREEQHRVRSSAAGCRSTAAETHRTSEEKRKAHAPPLLAMAAAAPRRQSSSPIEPNRGLLDLSPSERELRLGCDLLPVAGEGRGLEAGEREIQTEKEMQAALEKYRQFQKEGGSG
nr:unnamed protein product [Digitaria exilis]